MFKYLLSTTLFIAVLLFSGQVVFATTYGTNSYSECSFGSCPTPPPNQTPPPTVTPPVTNPPSEIVISLLNINEDNPVSGVVIDVVIDVKTINSLTNEQLSNDSIGEVALYAEDLLVGKGTLNDDGTVTIRWDIISYPASESLTVVVYSKEGVAIAKEDEPVTYVTGIQSIIDSEKARRAENNAQQVAGVSATKRSPSALSKILGETGSLGEIGKISNPIQLPKIVETAVVAFPFWIFVVLFVLALRLIWQSSREALYLNKIRNIIEQEKEINEQKYVFVTLASHYLNTPFSLINSSLGMFSTIDNVSAESLNGLQLAVAKLGRSINELIDSAQKSTALIIDSTQGNTRSVNRPVFSSPSFIYPIIGIALVLTTTNVLLQTITTISLNGIELLVQAIVFISVVVFFGLTVRSVRLRKEEKVYADHMLGQQTALDESRNEFIDHAATNLRGDVDTVFGTTLVLKNFSSYKYLDSGIKFFQNSLYKFELAKKVGIGAISINNIANIHLNEFINGVLDKNIDKINTKKIFVQNTIPDIMVSQNLLLFGFVLDTVIDNAIKFSKDSGTIEIQASEHGSMTTITVIDDGIGISESKLERLFSPFTRATPVQTYNYEGMGFSLYLSRLICSRISAELSIESTEDKGTRVTIKFPSYTIER